MILRVCRRNAFDILSRSDLSGKEKLQGRFTGTLSYLMLTDNHSKIGCCIHLCAFFDYFIDGYYAIMPRFDRILPVHMDFDH